MSENTICTNCGNKLIDVSYHKEFTPPKENCPECEKYRKNMVKVRYIKLSICPNCKNIVETNLSPEQIKKHRYDFSWGYIIATSKAKERLIMDAKKLAGMKNNDDCLKIEDKLSIFMAKLREIPQVHVANLVYVPVASHLKNLGWKILELHIVPKGRPPYFKIDELISKYEIVWEGISEINFLKVGDTYLVRIIESPVMLGHI